MENTDNIRAANSLMVQRLAVYLFPQKILHDNAIEGGLIKTKRVPNRTNVPTDAVTLSHLVEHDELGFSFRLRVVWREGRLFRPATHVVIEQEWDDSNLGTPAAVSAAINEWLQAVTP